MELLRFATAGSVDDGKSTLIGRLLYDSKQIFEDTLEALEHSTMLRGEEGVNLALLTDGLRAEREQGITIDVAYRYFATPRRKFIIADTPGHVQYTRNMVTGASTADLALILVDARKGIIEQSRRHAFLASLLGVPHLVLCVNKMDLVDYDEAVFERIKSEFRDFAAKLDVRDLQFVPMSALHGDNVVDRSPNTPWYEGTSLLHHLEEVHIASDRNLIDCRFPVQYVIRPRDDKHHDYRGYAGQIASGAYKVGDDVVVLPSGFMSTIASIDTADGPVEEAVPPMSVTIRLADDLDVSRGDMICRPHNQPNIGQDIDAMLCWFGERAALKAGGKYALKQTSKWTRALVKDLHYRLDVNTLHRDEDADSLSLNEIGRVTLRTTAPLFSDDYRRNRATGSFILVDEPSNDTLAAGMILQPVVVHDVAAAGFNDPGDYEAARPSYPPDAVAWFVENLELEPGRRVADVAAGTGKLTRLLAPAVGTGLFAVEPVAGMRATFRRVLPEVPLVAATAEAMPLRAASLDAITVAQAWHWFDHDRASAEAARVLRSGGRLGLVWNARDRTEPWVDEVWSIMDRVEKHAPWRNHDNWRDSAMRTMPGFGPLHESEFRHTQKITPEGVVQRVASVSHVAVLPEPDRAKVLAEVRDVLANQPAVRGREMVEIPYRVDCFWAERE